MVTWVIGDVHGCASELERLLDLLPLESGDTLVSVGDLFHRGPDPLGVARLCETARVRWILGNHERAALARHGLAPVTALGDDVRHDGAIPVTLVEPADLAGDGDRPMVCESGALPELFRFMLTHEGYFLESAALDGAASTPDGRAWCVVHAGLIPGSPPSEMTPFELTRLRRLDVRGRPFWHEAYAGPTLALFGHTPYPAPFRVEFENQLVAVGLDTGCVYGGSLTAYCPELDRTLSVPAERQWAEW